MDRSHKAANAALCFAGGASWLSLGCLRHVGGSAVLASAFPWLGERSCACRRCFFSAGAKLSGVVEGAASAACPVPISCCLFSSNWSQPRVQVDTSQPQIAGEKLDCGLKQIPCSSGQDESWALPEEPLARRSSGPPAYLSVLRDRWCLCLLMRKSMLCISASSSTGAG